MSLTGFALIVIPISSSTACGLTISNKIIYEIVMKKHNEYKKQYEKDEQTIKYFDKLYTKTLQAELSDKNENGSLCIIFTKYSDEKKWIFFINKNMKVKINFLSNNELKFNLEPRS